MVVTNHPLASAAGAEMLAAGGNAVDAAVAALFALTVVEPMMVGLLGGGRLHIRLADGTPHRHRRHEHGAAGGRPDMYRPVAGAAPEVYDVEGRANAVGPKAGRRAWHPAGLVPALRRFGTLPLADVMQPAIRHATRGFTVTPYLSECVDERRRRLLHGQPAIAALYCPTARRCRPARAWCRPTTPRRCASSPSEGADALHGGPLGDAFGRRASQQAGGFVAEDDLTDYRTVERAPIRGRYRDWEIVGPPPPPPRACTSSRC